MNRSVYGFAFIAAVAGFAAGDFTATAASSAVWKEVRTRSAAVARTIELLESDVAEIDARVPAPTPEPAPVQDAAQPASPRPVPLRVGPSRIQHVFTRQRTGEYHFAWEIRISNPGTVPIRRERLLYYFAGSEGEPLHVLPEEWVVLPAGCSRVVRGITMLYPRDIQRFTQVKVQEGEGEWGVGLGPIRDQARENLEKFRKAHGYQ